MMVYGRVKLGEVASIRGGKRLPAGKEFTTTETAHPYIRARDIGGGKVEVNDPVFLDEGTAQKLARYTVNKGDVCLTIVGANVGEMGVVPPHLDGANLTENAVKIVTNGKANQAFLKYALLSDDAMAQMKVLAGGAAQPKLGIYKIETIEFPYPPLPLQQRIASILSAYDELIENNQRRIRILEDMARSLYREWFVHFRYPGHEPGPLVDSPLRQIPQGWEVRKLKEVCNLTMGSSPKSEFYNETGEGQPFHQGVTNFGERFPTDRLFCTVEGRIAEAGDILFSVRAPVGRMNIADKRIIIGRGLSAIRHKGGHQAFLWEQLRAKFTEVDMMGNGAIFAAVTKDDMQGIELLCPAEQIVRDATRYFDPLHIEIEVLIKKTANLRRTRDLLLPRLLSGQVAISEQAA